MAKSAHGMGLRSGRVVNIIEIEQKAAASMGGIANDYIEESTDLAGKPIFSCKWLSCVDRKALWNLRSEIEHHMKGHTEPFGCTFDHCYRRFGSKSDWRQHEVKRHLQQDLCWRCDLSNPSSTSAQSCWKIFQSKQLFTAHLENVHQMTDARKVTENLIAQHISASIKPQYWCGFCKSVLLAQTKDKDTYPDRYDHIAEHITGEGRCFDDWVPQKGSLAKQERRKREEPMTDTEDGISDGNIDLSNSDEVFNFYEKIPPLPGGVLPCQSPASVAERRQEVKGQLESADVMSRKAPNADEATVSPIQEPVSASRASADPRDTFSAQALERSASQSSKLESRDSEGELEFMGLAVEGRITVGLSPGCLMTGDQEAITSTVTQLVQAYLRLSDLRGIDSRQCTNRSAASPGHDSGGVNSGSAASKQPVSINTTKCRKRARQDDEDDLEEDENPSKQTKATEEESANNTFACPYWKHDKRRYSELNTDTREKVYRRCASSYLKDISRLKQHLYRNHKRPSSYCGRCFETFTSQHELEEHSRAQPPCPVGPCPFAEKMNQDQQTSIRRRGDGKEPVAAWYTIFETLFPESTKPSSPFVEIISTEAAANFQHWSETPEAVAILRESFNSRIADHFPDPLDQFWIQHIHEECLSELAMRRGPSFHSNNRHERPADPPNGSCGLPSSGSAGQPLEETGPPSYTSTGVTSNPISMLSDPNTIFDPSFLVPPTRVADYSADNGADFTTGIDFTTQEGLPPLDTLLRPTSEALEEMDRPAPEDHIQDPFVFDTIAGQYFDSEGVPNQGLFTLDTSYAEAVDESSLEAQIGDDVP